MKKKINLGSKLSLDKETISRLDEQQLREIAGGGVNSLSCNGGAVAAVENDPGDDVMEDFNSCCNASCNTKA
jgi:hypothetical protein